MHSYAKIYDFAASAGAFEGYVYRREALDLQALKDWVEHLASAYSHLPPEVLAEIQPGLDQTIGRSARSLEAVLGLEHALVRTLKGMVKGAAPGTPDDFQKKKWFE